MKGRFPVPTEVSRLRWMLGAGVVWTGLLAGRLIQLQIVRHDELKKAAAKRHLVTVPLQAARGIVKDRGGRLLAVSVETDSLGMLLSKVAPEDTGAAVDLLLRNVRGVDRKDLLERIEAAREDSRGFVPVKRHLEPEESAALRATLYQDAKANEKHPDRRIAWIDIRKTSKRVYPNGSLAAHVLGSVTLDKKESESGQEGIERSLDTVLRGKPGKATLLHDVRGQHVDAIETDPAVPGKALTLTISAPLQHFTDQRLARAVAETGAVSGAAIAMDAGTGEVLALSSYPTFDPNVRPKFDPDETKKKTDPERVRRFNQATMGASEPGSVGKYFTFAAALKHTAYRPTSWIGCGNGVYRAGDKEIVDPHCSGGMLMREAFWHSSNMVSIQLALAMNPASKFRNSLAEFGIGEKTGIELPGEVPGQLSKQWRRTSPVFHSFGYEYRISPLQLARAVAAIANGGEMVGPTLIKSIESEEGAEEKPAPKPRVRILSPDASLDMQSMAEGVVLFGTGKGAKVPGYDVAGKTGTAKRIENKRYTSTYNSTFAGFGPARANRGPRVVVVVQLHRTLRMASDTAAPAYSDIMAAAMRHLGVAPDRELPPEPGEEAPSGPVGILPKIAELRAPAPVLMPASQTRTLTVGPGIPDFRGKDKKQIAIEALERDIAVELIGRGVAVHQHPAPGEWLAPGQKVKVQFDH